MFGVRSLAGYKKQDGGGQSSNEIQISVAQEWGGPLDRMVY